MCIGYRKEALRVEVAGLQITIEHGFDAALLRDVVRALREDA